MSSDDDKAHLVIIHEDVERTLHFTEHLKKYGIPFRLLKLDHFHWKVNQSCPFIGENDIYYSRLSASSSFRGNAAAVDFAKVLLKRLEESGSKVLNGISALELEINKWYQCLTLTEFGIKTPKTLACSDDQEMIQYCESHFNVDERLILKPNCGGSGYEVKSFSSPKEVVKWLSTVDKKTGKKNTILGGDGITLIQSYIIGSNSETTKDYAYRLEMIGGLPLYILRIDSSKGYSLCPCDAKENDERFAIIKNPTDIVSADFVDRCSKFCEKYKLNVCAFEFKLNTQNDPIVYDLNTNVNYNQILEAKEDKHGFSVFIESQILPFFPHSSTKE